MKETKKDIKKEVKKRKRRNMNVPLDEFYDEFDFENAIISYLKAARIKAGLSQSALAKKIGVRQSAIARLESRNFNLTLAFLKKVILALNLELTISERKPFDRMI